MNKTEKNDLIGYQFIRNKVVHSGITPSLREIGRVVGYTSPRSVQLMLERLQKRGLLSYTHGTIKLSLKKYPTMSEETINVPLVGSVACGLPSLAEQAPEAVIPVSTKIARPGHTYFFLRAKGNSMNKSGIQNGDFVLVRQQNNADEGQKVVALINDEATIKHFQREGGIIILRPNSTEKSHKPILVSENLTIQGVIIGVFPKSII